MKIVVLLARMKVAQRRGLAAWIVYLTFVAALYALPGPLVEAYAVTSAVLLVATCWLVFGTMVTERSATAMLAAAAGGSPRLHAMQVAAGVLAALPLGLIAIIWGLVVAWPKHPGQVIVVGLLAQAVAILVGAGIGAIAARPVLADGALSLSVAIGLLIIVLAIPASSPYGPSLLHLSHGESDVAVLLLGLAGGVVWAVVLTIAGGLIAARRRAYGMAAPDA